MGSCTTAGGGIGMGCMLRGGRGKSASTVAEIVVLLVLALLDSEDEASCRASRLAIATPSLVALFSCSDT